MGIIACSAVSQDETVTRSISREMGHCLGQVSFTGSSNCVTMPALSSLLSSSSRHFATNEALLHYLELLQAINCDIIGNSPEARIVPSLLKHRAYTIFVCPFSWATTAPVDRSQIMTKLSAPEVDSKETFMLECDFNVSTEHMETTQAVI